MTGSQAARAMAGTVVSGALAGVLLLAATVPVAAQSRIQSDVDTTLVTVGGRITLTVRVAHPVDASVVWPDSVDLSPFEVLGARLEPTATEGGGAVSTAVFSIAAFELGELEIPSFQLSVLNANGESQQLATDRFGVEVTSVGSDETGDIRGIRGPMSIAVSVLWLALWALLFMLLGAAGFALYRRWRRRSRTVEHAVRGPPPRAPHEVALEALDALDASPMLARGEVKEYHVQASDILRRYVEAVFGVPALEMTTWEVIAGLEREDAPGEARAELRRFLDQCDLVKFAKVRPDADTARSTLALGRSIVEGTVAVRPVASDAAPSGPTHDEPAEAGA